MMGGVVTLRVLGSGGAFGHGGRLQACALLEHGTERTLIDCGTTSLLALRRFAIDPQSVDAVLLTHFHGDHVGGIPWLVLDAQFADRERPLVVAGPRGVAERITATMEDVVRGLSRTKQRFELRFVEYAERAPVAVGSLAVTAYPVDHTPGSEPVALRVAVGERVLAVSGDTTWTDTLLEVARGADLFLAEGYSYEKRIPYHLSVRALVDHRAALGARRIVVTHVGEETLARLADVPFEVAEDGSRYEL